jgi:hypothetical protein
MTSALPTTKTRLTGDVELLGAVEFNTVLFAMSRNGGEVMRPRWWRAILQVSRMTAEHRRGPR